MKIIFSKFVAFVSVNFDILLASSNNDTSWKFLFVMGKPKSL